MPSRLEADIARPTDHSALSVKNASQLEGVRGFGQKSIQKIRELLATAPSSITRKRITIYGMSMGQASGRYRKLGNHFQVKNQAACVETGSGEETADGENHVLGCFELLTACTLNGHLHLVHYLLTKEEGDDA